MDTTTRHKTAQCAPGNRVRIVTSEREIDPNTYRVKEFDRQLAILINLNTSKEIKVHKSRIVQNLDAQESTEVSDSANTNETASSATKTKAKRKAPKLVKLDVKALAAAFGAGCEHYIQKVEGFDHPDKDVRAHTLILSDHRSFITFNTYDGTLGRKVTEADIERIINGAKKGDVEKPLKSYDLADDAAYEKKVELLRKGGYTKRPL